MDVCSVRGLVTLVVQLHSIVIFAQAVSGEQAADRARRTKTDEGDHKPCCYNGGLCVLGSFCHCPENFYGRYCEYELKRKPCGHVPHGSWVKAGCNLCHCYDGHMSCLPRAFNGCDEKPLKEEIDPWDYKDEMVIFAADDPSSSDQTDSSADYYDYYDTDSENSAHRASHEAVSPLLALLLWWLVS